MRRLRVEKGSEFACEIAECSLFDLLAEHDSIAEDADCSCLKKIVSVDTTEGHGPGRALSDHGDCLIQRRGNRKSGCKVVERAEWENAKSAPGPCESPCHHADGAVTTRDEHRRIVRHGSEVVSRIEVDPRVLRKCSIHHALGCVVDCFRTTADDQKARRRGAASSSRASPWRSAPSLLNPACARGR